MHNTQKVSIKMVFLGDGGVGKTSICKRYLNKGYKENYLSTIGAEFYSKEQKYSFDDTGEIIFNWMIWDLGGQPTFNEVRTSYYQGAKGAILVYDIARPPTFQNLSNWINNFWNYASEKYPLVLVANKVDLRGTDQENISTNQGKQYANRLSEVLTYNVPYLETSAKENRNIAQAFNLLAKLICQTTKRT